MRARCKRRAFLLTYQMKIKSKQPVHKNRYSSTSSFYQTKEWKKLVAIIWDRDDGICQQCKDIGLSHYLERSTTDMRKQGTIDHISPRPAGANYNPDTWDNERNLRLIGSIHHASKRAKERKNI